jgi:uncharacterized protein (DUF697 family)
MRMSELNYRHEPNASADENADAVIKAMVASIAAAAIIPAHVNWAVIMGLMGGGVVAIGHCYGVTMTKDEAWKLIKQFFMAAGFTFLALNVGSRMISMLLASTPLTYGAAVAIDIAAFCPMAYAIGGCAKSYFKGERDKARLGEIFRNRFQRARRNPNVA